MDIENNLGFGADAPETKEDDIEIVIDDTQDKEPKSSEPGADNVRNDTDEATKNKKPKDPNKTKMNQILRERYQIENEKNVIAQENERLRLEMERLKQINTFSTQAAVTNYETSTLDRLDRAKDLKVRALESGDVKEQIEADIALNTALSEMERLKGWKENQKLNEQQQKLDAESFSNNPYHQQQYEQQQYENHVNNQDLAAQEWYQQNEEWFDPKGESYDADAAEFAARLSDNMDTVLYRNGRQDAIYSPEYLQYLNEQVDKFKEGHYNDRRRPSNSNRSQSMSTPPRSIVSPVNNNNVNRASNRKEVRLNNSQMDFAKKLSYVPGVTPEIYAKYVKEYRDDLERNNRTGDERTWRQ